MTQSAATRVGYRTRVRLHGDSLGVKAADSGDLIRLVRRGFSYKALQALEQRSGLAVARIAAAIEIPERTLARRKASGRFTSDESERLLRISGVFEDALDLFEGDVPSAINWLTTPKKALENHTPLDYARTGLGAREVESLIGRLEHGVFS